MSVLPLRTARLALRVMDLADAAVLAAYRSDPDVARYQDWELPYDAGRAAAMLADQDEVTDLVPGRPVQVAIEHDGEVIGKRRPSGGTP